MERDIINKWALNRKILLKDSVVERFALYANLIQQANRNFNITGLKTVREILSELILGSLDPLCDIIVPRGTRFVDIGSGAGIPGIVLALFFEDVSGVLIEANHKKADFLRKAADILDLGSIDVVTDRAENAGRDEKHRESFDRCFARAFGKLYIAMELAAPLLKKDGIFYVYRNETKECLTSEETRHLEKMGLQIMSPCDFNSMSVPGAGLSFKKYILSEKKFPRRYSVIKREAEKIQKYKNGKSG